MSHKREQSMQHQSTQENIGADLQELIIEELKLLLAEIRTSMASLRTGLMLFVLPLLVVSTIIVTSKHHNLMSVIRHPVAIALSSAMVLSGAYLVIKAFLQIRVYNHQIAKIQEKYGAMPGLQNVQEDD
jgi:predicted transporter